MGFNGKGSNNSSKFNRRRGSSDLSRLDLDSVMEAIQSSVGRESEARLIKSDDVGILTRVKADLEPALEAASTTDELLEEGQKYAEGWARQSAATVGDAVSKMPAGDPSAQASIGAAQAAAQAGGLAARALAGVTLVGERLEALGGVSTAVQRTAGLARNLAHTMIQRGMISTGFAEDLSRGVVFISDKGAPIDVKTTLASVIMMKEAALIAEVEAGGPVMDRILTDRQPLEFEFVRDCLAYRASVEFGDTVIEGSTATIPFTVTLTCLTVIADPKNTYIRLFKGNKGTDEIFADYDATLADAADAKDFKIDLPALVWVRVSDAFPTAVAGQALPSVQPYSGDELVFEGALSGASEVAALAKAGEDIGKVIQGPLGYLQSAEILTKTRVRLAHTPGALARVAALLGVQQYQHWLAQIAPLSWDAVVGYFSTSSALVARAPK